MEIVVLGAGLVGAPMAMDLAADDNFNVTLADISPNALKKVELIASIKTVCIDLSVSKKVSDFVAQFDIVINAVPGFMGYKTLEAIIDAGKNVVDIAFFPENPFDLDKKAKDKNITAIVDCGVAPGMSHLLTGYAQSKLDEVDKVRIYVGGLPVVRTWPYEYKAVFSPADVIEEYTRPARLVENSTVVEKEALSECELLDFPGVGTLEAFNSDGLRTLTETIKAKDMAEKTLRYPGHVNLMKVLRHSGFFEKTAVDINGIKISPLDVTSKMLQKDWQLKSGEEDLTVMQIIVKGKKQNKAIRHQFDLLDYFDTASGIHSMARTTGYTATVVARLLANDLIPQKGIVVPEYLGTDEKIVKMILAGLEERGIHYSHKTEILY